MGDPAAGPGPMPFDQRQRYGVVAALLAELDSPSPLTVLDVGGHFQLPDGRSVRPIEAAISGHRTICLDLASLESGEHVGSGYVRGDGRLLPFRDRSIAVVSCLDALEHVPHAGRPRLLAEVMRVASRYVVIAAPVADVGVEDRERQLSAFVTAVLHAEQAQLAEHRELGLPTDEEIRASLPPATVSFGYGNLDAWFAVMLARHLLLGIRHASPALDRLEREYTAHADAVDRCPPFYRRFYLVPAGPDVAAVPLHRVQARFAAPTARPGPEGAGELYAWLFSILADSDAGRLAAERRPLEERIADLERVFRDVETSFVYKLYRWTRAWSARRAPSDIPAETRGRRGNP